MAGGCASRFFFGGLTVAFVARAQGRSLVVTQRAAAWQRSILGTISAAGTFYLYATPHLPIGDAATLLATAPIFVAILGVPLLGERVGPHVAFALAMGFAGIALVAHPSFSSARTWSRSARGQPSFRRLPFFRSGVSARTSRAKPSCFISRAWAP